jgi:hypothetical protein
MFEKSINGNPALGFPAGRAFGGPPESGLKHLVLKTASQTTTNKTFKVSEFQKFCCQRQRIVSSILCRRHPRPSHFVLRWFGRKIDHPPNTAAMMD